MFSFKRNRMGKAFPYSGKAKTLPFMRPGSTKPLLDQASIDLLKKGFCCKNTNSFQGNPRVKRGKTSTLS